MKLQRNDVIALVLGTGLIALAVTNKMDWPAVVAYVIGLLSKQPSPMTPPADPAA